MVHVGSFRGCCVWHSAVLVCVTNVFVYTCLIWVAVMIFVGVVVTLAGVRVFVANTVPNGTVTVSLGKFVLYLSWSARPTETLIARDRLKDQKARYPPRPRRLTVWDLWC